MEKQSRPQLRTSSVSPSAVIVKAAGPAAPNAVPSSVPEPDPVWTYEIGAAEAAVERPRTRAAKKPVGRSMSTPHDDQRPPAADRTDGPARRPGNGPEP